LGVGDIGLILNEVKKLAQLCGGKAKRKILGDIFPKAKMGPKKRGPFKGPEGNFKRAPIPKGGIPNFPGGKVSRE